MYAVMVTVIVATCLALAATALRDRQEANVALEKKENILKAAGVDIEVLKPKETSAVFDEKVEQYVIDHQGNEKEGVNAFNVELDKELKKTEEERNLPLYTFQKDGQKLYVLPIRGKGLWGPIWGYVALEDDFNTIYGVYFDHKTETPGLGAEIATDKFQYRFPGKKIFTEEGEYVGVEVLKGEGNVVTEHSVDGLSGATVTARGVYHMIRDGLKMYLPYFNKHKKNIAA